MKNRVVEVYSKALFKKFVSENSEFLSELEDFITVYRKQLKNFFENKKILARDKISTFQKISTELQLEKAIEEMVIYLIQKGRMGYFEEIFHELKLLYQYSRLECEIVAKFAFEPTAAQLEEIRDIFEMKLEKTVKIRIEIDRDILGGCIICYQDREYNGSLRYQLENLKHQFQ